MRMLKVSEVAQVLRCSPRQFRKILASGRRRGTATTGKQIGPGSTRGRKGLLIQESSLEEFLATPAA